MEDLGYSRGDIDKYSIALPGMVSTYLPLYPPALPKSTTEIGVEKIGTSASERLDILRDRSISKVVLCAQISNPELPFILPEFFHTKVFISPTRCKQCYSKAIALD